MKPPRRGPLLTSSFSGRDPQAVGGARSMQLEQVLLPQTSRLSRNPAQA
jgi:hypothetical protein